MLLVCVEMPPPAYCVGVFLGYLACTSQRKSRKKRQKKMWEGGGKEGVGRAHTCRRDGGGVGMAVMSSSCLADSFVEDRVRLYIDDSGATVVLPASLPPPGPHGEGGSTRTPCRRDAGDGRGGHIAWRHGRIDDGWMDGWMDVLIGRCLCILLALVETLLTRPVSFLFLGETIVISRCFSSFVFAEELNPPSYIYIFFAVLRSFSFSPTETFFFLFCFLFFFFTYRK